MPANDSFLNLINDITQQVLEQVQTQVQQTVSSALHAHLNNLVSEDAIKNVIVSRIQEDIGNYTPDLSHFTEQIQNATNTIVNSLNDRANKEITDLVAARVNTLDIYDIVGQILASRLDDKLAALPFKDNSVPGRAIRIDSLKISGDNIVGGVASNFASTGIEDKASQCQITILDQATVLENTLYAPHIEIKGGAVIDGDLSIMGTLTDTPAYQKLVLDTGDAVLANIGPNLLNNYQTVMYEHLRDEGIDLGKISINGELVIDGKRLTNAVVDSQLQSVGVLRDLQTEGENLLSKTLYVSNRRVGINTMDPNTALSIWDEEIEIGLGKQSQNIARIATARDNTLIIGTNKQDNITLTPDGITTIPKLRLGKMLFSSSSIPPNYNAERGTVIFNENPSLGGPLGWVSLGDARWANFGIIE